MPPTPRQYLLGPERQLTTDSSAEPLLEHAEKPAPSSSAAAGDRRQQPLQLGPHGSSRQLALALFPEERRNPKAAVVLDDLDAVVKDWKAFWAPLEAELEEVRQAGAYKCIESVKLLALGRWIHGLRHDAVEEESPPRPGRDAGCPLQIPARGLVDVLCCTGRSARARLRRAFRVLAELKERGEIRRYPRTVTLRWATRHRPPDMQITELEDLDAEGNEISRRRVDVHGVVFFTWKGVGFIQRRGDRIQYRVLARARSERRVKVIAGPNAAVLTTFNRQLRRIATRLRRGRPPSAQRVQACIPSPTSIPTRVPRSTLPERSGAAAHRPPHSSEHRSAQASVSARSAATPAPAPHPLPAPAPSPRRQTAQGPIPENKGAAPRAAGRGPARFAAHAAEDARLTRLSQSERDAEHLALRRGWSLPELREEAERCWSNVEWVPYPDVRGRPVYFGDGQVRTRPKARPITTPERWRPIAWQVTSEAGREQLRQMFAPVAALVMVRIRRGEQPPTPSWQPPPKRKRGRYDTGLHAFGRGRCKGCKEMGPLMYEADVRGTMVPLGYCQRCWDEGQWRPSAASRPPRPATPSPPPVMRPAEASATLADILRRTLGERAATAFRAKFKLDKKR